MNRDQGNRRSQENCLSDDDLCRYVALPQGSGLAPDLETHLSNCPDCREELAQLLKLLHPETRDAPDDALAPSEAEIAQTVALIQGVARQEERRKQSRRWVGWAAAAAAAIALLSAGAAGYKVYDAWSRSHRYLAQARASLEEVYLAESPGGLRLDLPFPTAPMRRAAAADSPLDRAQLFFTQALEAREDLPEAHVGLASIYLSRSQFAAAREEFEKALNVSGNHFQALVGRGVAQYEEARVAEDPVARSTLLNNALGDLDRALKQQPNAAGARYNRAWVLYEAGRHQEVLTEIDSYLAQDPDSNWATRLRDLQTRIRLLKWEDVNKEVARAARNRDAAALSRLSRLLPEKIPAAIRQAIKLSLRQEAGPVVPGAPDSADLRWAAETLEAAYSAHTGDGSWKGLLDFYAGLPPEQRRTKRSLDLRFDALEDLHYKRQLTEALHGSESLEQEYARLRDQWQLFNIHFLRGNCLYYQADFKRAEAEYHQMRMMADKIGAPEMRARALAALLAAYAAQTRPDEEKACIAALDEVATDHKLDSWKAFVAQASGSLHLKLSQYQECIKDFTVAMSSACREHDENLLGMLLESVSLIMVRLGRSEDALRLWGEAVEVMALLEREAGQSQEVDIVAHRGALICRQGELALLMGDLDRAAASFERGLAMPLEKMRELECRLRFGLAQARLGQKRFVDTRILLEQSLALADSGGYEELLWQASYLQGKMYVELGDTAAALSAFQRSVDQLESMRGKIASLDLRQQFLTRRFDPYKEIVSLLHFALHDGEKALEFADRAKSMTLREYLHRPAGSRAGETADIASSLNALTVDYFFTADGLLAFVSDPDRKQVIELKSSRPRLEAEVNAFLASITRGDEASFSSLSRKLYDTLVDPILRLVGSNGYAKLLVFPDGPLHLLPFGGLQDAHGQYLLQKFSLSYAPSRSVLNYCLSLERGSANSHSRTMLLLDGTANLPGAGDELARLAKLYGNNTRLLAARNLNLADRLAAEADILHFAGHGTMVNGKPALMLQSAPRLVCVDSAVISSWQLRRNRLVTLAGCETGIGPQAEGETPWGLIPAFLNAGAPALIVSLLPVDDVSTLRLTSRFYELLAGTMSKASALQQAQISLMEAARASGRLNPASWLPYVLIGDPR
jgi:CHAT domain-containing protein/predicted negative regulator of RcsB-dependent stress response